MFLERIYIVILCRKQKEYCKRTLRVAKEFNATDN